MTTPLSEKRFRELLDVYGAEIARFPEPERRGAELLLSSSERARAWLAEERELDARVEEALASTLEPLSPELERRLGAIPSRHAQARRGRLIQLFVPAVAWAAAACVGLLIGSGVLPIGIDSESSDESAEVLQSEEEALVALALGSGEGFEVWP